MRKRAQLTAIEQQEGNGHNANKKKQTSRRRTNLAHFCANNYATNFIICGVVSFFGLCAERSHIVGPSLWVSGWSAKHSSSCVDNNTKNNSPVFGCSSVRRRRRRRRVEHIIERSGVRWRRQW